MAPNIACTALGAFRSAAGDALSLDSPRWMTTMRSFLVGTALLAVSFTPATTSAQSLAAASGSSVVAQMPCLFTTFEQQSTFTRRFYSKDEYETAKNSRTIECFRIQYISDELKVVGFLVR